MQGAAEVLKKSKSLRLANTCRNRFRTTQLNNSWNIPTQAISNGKRR